MKIISWNVNGLRSVLNKGFIDFVKTENPDAICLQEIKIDPEAIDRLSIFDEDLPNYTRFWNSAEKKGYSGTAIFTKNKPINHAKGIDSPEHDSEGRALLVEFDNSYLLTIYVPNSQRTLARLDFRLRWDAKLLEYIKHLEKHKPVIVCGDMNVAPEEIDLAHPKANIGNPGFTIEERNSFKKFLESGFVDTYRHFHKQPHRYTWWSYMKGARNANVGWRLDHFLISGHHMDQIAGSKILAAVKGSDHCPILIETSDKVSDNS